MKNVGFIVRVLQFVSLMTALPDTPRTGFEPRNRCLRQTGPGSHPASYTMDTGSLSPGRKRPGRGVDHPLTSSPEVKERVQLYLYSPSGL